MSLGHKFIALCIVAALIVTGVAVILMGLYGGGSSTEASSDSESSNGPDDAEKQGESDESGDLDRVRDQDRTKQDIMHDLGQT